MDSQALLEKHNPLLVIFPQEHEGRVRPGSNDPGPRGWGDYHPCSAEFFLAHALLRHKPGRWEFSKMLRPWGVLWGSWTATNPDGFEAIRQRVTEAETTEPESTREWELDVARIPSQDEKRAWQEYREMLNPESTDAERPWGWNKG